MNLVPLAPGMNSATLMLLLPTLVTRTRLILTVLSTKSVSWYVAPLQSRTSTSPCLSTMFHTATVLMTPLAVYYS